MLSCVVLENVVHAMKREGTVQLSSSAWQLQLRLQGRQTQFEKLRVASVSESWQTQAADRSHLPPLSPLPFS